jgi:hypothetical protein
MAIWGMQEDTRDLEMTLTTARAFDEGVTETCIIQNKRDFYGFKSSGRGTIGRV